MYIYIDLPQTLLSKVKFNNSASLELNSRSLCFPTSSSKNSPTCSENQLCNSTKCCAQARTLNQPWAGAGLCGFTKNAMKGRLGSKQSLQWLLVIAGIEHMLVDAAFSHTVQIFCICCISSVALFVGHRPVGFTGRAPLLESIIANLSTNSSSMAPRTKTKTIIQQNWFQTVDLT